MKRIAFYTLGCKVNQADTASMEAIFRSHGYTVVGFNCEADIYVINTCVVTNTGQRKSRQMINRAVRRNPTAFVVVTGCYPQTAAEEVKTIPGVGTQLTHAVYCINRLKSSSFFYQPYDICSILIPDNKINTRNCLHFFCRRLWITASHNHESSWF